MSDVLIIPTKEARYYLQPGVMRSPISCLLLLFIAILGVGCPSAQAKSPKLGWKPVFSTYLGGTTPYAPGGTPHTFAQNAACDTQGNTYVTGGTQVTDLPGTQNGFQPNPGIGSTMSAFVAKFDPLGNLLWCTYLGGNNQSMGVGVAAMPDGGVAVAGLTSSDHGTFFTMSAYQAYNNGQSDYFVAVLAANGYPRYITLLGGSGPEGPPGAGGVFIDDGSNGNNVAVDAQGLVYVTGTTCSSGSGRMGPIKFPVTTNAIQPGIGGDTDAFLCIIDPSQSGKASLVYSSFHGGEKNDKGHSVAVNASGSLITVAGYTQSTNLHTTNNAYRQQAPPSGFTSNGFVTQFTSSQPGATSSGYTRNYSTYLGADTADARDDTYGIALDPTGLIVATGRTQSPEFPMTPPGTPSIFNHAPYTSQKGGDEPYVVKIDPNATPGAATLVYSTFLGGGSADGTIGTFCTSVAVDALGSVYLGGQTNSVKPVLYTPSSTPQKAPHHFPYTRNARLPVLLQGAWDAIFMQINPNGAQLDYSNYLGGTGDDRTYGLAVDPKGYVVLSGLTFSANFPTTPGALPFPGIFGCQNAFVTKLSPVGAPPGLSLLHLLTD